MAASDFVEEDDADTIEGRIARIDDDLDNKIGNMLFHFIDPNTIKSSIPTFTPEQILYVAAYVRGIAGAVAYTIDKAECCVDRRLEFPEQSGLFEQMDKLIEMTKVPSEADIKAYVESGMYMN